MQLGAIKRVSAALLLVHRSAVQLSAVVPSQSVSMRPARDWAIGNHVRRQLTWPAANWLSADRPQATRRSTTRAWQPSESTTRAQMCSLFRSSRAPLCPKSADNGERAATRRSRRELNGPAASREPVAARMSTS